MRHIIPGIAALLFFMLLPRSMDGAARYWIATSESNWNSTANWSQDASGRSIAVGVNSFSDFTVSDISNPLPVELTAFAALYRNHSVFLNWSTATEVNNYGFKIERSLNGIDWSDIGFTPGAGTINTPQSYSYIDALDPELRMRAELFYRLRQMDRDGKHSFSLVLAVRLKNTPKELEIATVQGNAVREYALIGIFTPRDQRLTIHVYNMLGSEMLFLPATLYESGVHTVRLPVHDLPGGLYMVHCNGEFAGANTRIMVNR